MTTIAIEHGEPTADIESAGRRAWWQRVVRGREADPVWVRPALLVLLVGTCLLYVRGLGNSGWANSFYSAAVEAGSKSWKAFFFGSFDSSNFISVDKPPASLWVMDISVRLFGLNSWSILVPQALEGVAAVGLLYATVRRHFSASAGLIAGLVLATTPVATLMFRYNNPDALLVLLLVGAAYAFTRALEATSTRWLVLAGALIGFGFITKMLQAFLIVPGFGLIYLVYAQTTLRRRIVQLLLAGVAIVVAAGWWVAAVALTPASSRPYVGGSTNNSILQLIFGYNGFGRLTGNETGSVGGGGQGGSGMWGPTGITRMFGTDFGREDAWLIPAALILAGTTLWAVRRARRSDPQRSQVFLWLSWLLVTGLVFSFSKGIIHPYYTVALAPAIGALVGIGAVGLWRLRDQMWGRIAIASTIAVTAVWSDRLLGREPSWHPWLRGFILIVGLVVAAASLVPPGQLSGWMRPFGVLIAVGAMVAALGGPVAYSLDTAATVFGGAIPNAGPATTGASSGRPGGAGGPGAGGFGQHGVFPPGFGGQAGRGGGFGIPPGFGGRHARGLLGPGTRITGPAGTHGIATGGLLSAPKVSAALRSALKANASLYTWVAAAVGSEDAAGYQLAADEPVMSIGGFNGTDPAPSLAQFEKYVAEGKIHYFIGGGGFGRQQGGSTDGSQISQWVSSHFTATTIGGTTVYDLTSSSSATTTGATSVA